MTGNITVEEFTRQQAVKPSANLGSRHSLEAAPLEALQNEMHDVQIQGGRIFRLTWQGSRVPDGAVVAGVTIGNTQHGVVRDTEGIPVGIYVRIKDYEGPSSNNEMLMALFPKE